MADIPDAAESAFGGAQPAPHVLLTQDVVGPASVGVESPSAFVPGGIDDDNLLGGVDDDQLEGFDGDDTLQGLAGNDILYGDAGNDHLMGGEGNDTMFGGIGNDTLSSDAGIDSLTGGDGDDVFDIDDSADLVLEFAGGGNDTVRSTVSVTLADEVENLLLMGADAIDGAGNVLDNVIQGNEAVNIIFGGQGNDEVRGLGGDDALLGDDGNDTLNGGAGNDTLWGDAGDDLLVGGAGDDVYDVDSAADQVQEAANGGFDSVQATVSHTLAANVEDLLLYGEDAIDGSGNGLDNYLQGNDAANTLNGMAGGDTLEGMAGDDSYVVDSADDLVLEVAGGGFDSVRSTVSHTLTAEVEQLTLTGTSALNGSGNALANTITGNVGANTLTGGDGNDTLSGSDGNDLLDGGTGNDSLTGGAGNDSYVVQSSGDRTIEASGGGTADSVSASLSWTLGAEIEKLVLTGSSAINGTGNLLANTITGNTGDNSLLGAEGNDTLSGGNGNDVLYGGDGNDSMTGGAGNDSYTVQSSGDKTIEVSGGGTADSVSASLSWTLAAEIEKLTLSGTDAINGTGNDMANTITGNTGNNLLNGGSGNDTLSGGAGLDTFRFSSALNGSSNVDTLSGFITADDAIQLENSVFLKLTTTGQLASTSFAANSTGTAVDSNDYIVYETDTGKLFYDADGNGAGVAVLFATLTGMPVINNLDFFVT